MREQIRIWTETVETVVLEIISGQRRGKRAAVARVCLFLLSKVYALAVRVRRILYNFRILRDSTLGVQVIAIGNLTVGGTGKTPVVEKFARELKQQGRVVAILSRGYRSKPPPLSKRLVDKLLFREDTTPPRVVSDGRSLLLDSETAGDEPYMLASNLKDVVVLVDKDRVKSGRYANPVHTSRGPAPSSLPRATVTPPGCGPASRGTIRRPASSSASTTRSTSKTCSPASSTNWICSRDA